MNPEPACDLCDGTGQMTWQQPVLGLDGALTLRQMSHPCVSGCSGWRKMPAAELAGVVDADRGSVTIGNVALSNQDHRCDWFLPCRDDQRRPDCMG
jgi:hypothetical protein